MGLYSVFNSFMDLSFPPVVKFAAVLLNDMNMVQLALYRGATIEGARTSGPKRRGGPCQDCDSVPLRAANIAKLVEPGKTRPTGGDMQKCFEDLRESLKRCCSEGS